MALALAFYGTLIVAMLSLLVLMVRANRYPPLPPDCVAAGGRRLAAALTVVGMTLGAATAAVGAGELARAWRPDPHAVPGLVPNLLLLLTYTALAAWERLRRLGKIF